MKKRDILKRVTTLCLGACMVFPSGLMTVSAAEPETPTMSITKELQMAEGTTTPNATFTFDFVAEGMKSTVNGELDTAKKGPEIVDASVTFETLDVGTTEAGVKSVIEETPDLLAGIDANEFGAPGYYYYTVNEIPDTYALGANESLDYSGAEYSVVFSVFSDGKSGLEIAGATVINTKDDAGSEIGDPQKVDASTTVDGKGNGFRFKNVYGVQKSVKPEVDPVDPSNPVDADNLWIGKLVSGELGDQKAYFPFDVALEAPAVMTSSTATEYKAYIMKYENNAWIYTVDAEEAAKVGNAAADADGNYYVTLAFDAVANVNLRHNTALCVTGLPVGAKYQATETYAGGDYDTTCKLLVDGTDKASVTVDTEKQLIGNGANAAFFTNNKDASVITGVVINNMPYIAMLALAFGAFALLVAKTRKNRMISK